MKRLISNIYNSIALSSPRAEVMLRKLYWKNVELLSFLSPNKNNRIYRNNTLKFEEVLSYLKNNGVNNGSLVVVHSSYGNLKPLSFSPSEVNDELIKLIGDSGTLAMPVIRAFKEDNLSLKDKLNDKIGEVECTYDINKTQVISGVLGIDLMKRKDSVTSKFPLNPLTAIGRLSDKMMEQNLEGDLPSPHGPNSSWKFCADNDALIVYLGVDFGHHLTMQHVSAECNDNWELKDFYINRDFKIIDGENVIYKTVRERRQKWTVYLAEKNVRKMLLKEGIVKATNIDGVPVSVIKAKELLSFYDNHSNKTFPYYV
jgi:aminoglycoside 3-N-acetyltransferase